AQGPEHDVIVTCGQTLRISISETLTGGERCHMMERHTSTRPMPCAPRIPVRAGKGAEVSRVPRRSTVRGRGGVAAVGAASLVLAPLVAATPAAAQTTDGDVFISEIHYDNDGTDEGEAIEVQAPAGTDLTGWQIVLYNGSDGASYDTTTLSETVGDAGVVVQDYPTNGIENGSPDGIA